MYDLEKTLAGWKASLATNIPLAGLLSRNKVAYKWKSPFRAWMLREAVAWRLQDVLSQSWLLHAERHSLGARILLRSGFETLATLIYLNQLIQQVLDGNITFGEFGAKTTVLLLGARNNPDAPVSINIMTVLKKCERRYPGIEALYADLSESAHPSYEGLMTGYSKLDRDEYETNFSNRWEQLHRDRHPAAMELCMETFLYEYNDVWPRLMDRFEAWIEANDAALKAAKDT